MRSCALAGVLALIVPIIAWSQPAVAPTRATQPPPEPAYPAVTVGVLSYLQYSAELEHRNGFNAFDVTRGYINITGDLARNIRFRLTPDVRRMSDGSLAGSLVFRLKYGFVQFDNLTPRSWLRFGLHQTPWLDFEEAINRYRVQGTMFAEREGLIPGSGDFGAGYQIGFPGEYGEIQAGIYNGEGFTQAESAKSKSVQARATVRPFPSRGALAGLRLSGFVNRGSYGSDRPRHLGIVMGSFEHRHVVATWQWLTATEAPVVAEVDRRGVSGFVELRQGPEGWAGILRVDRFDPDTARSDDTRTRVIAGVAHWLRWSRVRVGVLANDEIVRNGEAAGRGNEQRLLVQMHVQF